MVMNPYATIYTILACLDLDLSMAFAKDDTRMCTLDYLWDYENVECLMAIARVLCMHRDAYTHRTSA